MDIVICVQNLVFFIMSKHSYGMLVSEILIKFSETCLKRTLGRKECCQYRKTFIRNDL